MSVNSLDVGVTTLDAKGNGSGVGGSITLTHSGKVDLSQAVVTATGGDSGAGGSLKVSRATGAADAELNWDAVANVLSGPNYVQPPGGTVCLAGLTECGFEGTITNRQVTCKEWKIDASWPKFYWNCSNPTDPTINQESIKGAMSGLPSSFKATLGTGPTPVSVYVFFIANDYNEYFNAAIQTQGLNGISQNSVNRAAVFDRRRNGATIVNISQFLRGHLMHELAHLIDGRTNLPSQNPSFTVPSNDDRAFIQAQPCMAVFNDQQFCADHNADADSLVSLDTAFIAGQNIHSEMFAFGFQNCSGFGVKDGALDFAEQNAMTNIFNFMNTTFWPGGCR